MFLVGFRIKNICVSEFIFIDTVIGDGLNSRDWDSSCIFRLLYCCSISEKDARIAKSHFFTIIAFSKHLDKPGFDDGPEDTERC